MIKRLEHTARLAEVELSGDEYRVSPLPMTNQPTGSSNQEQTSTRSDGLCPTCSGSGNCQTCYGGGETTNYATLKRVKCSQCRGNGRCPTCGGKGRVRR